MTALYAVGILSLALLLGKYLYFRFGILQRYLLQPALLAGILLFVCGPGAGDILAVQYYDLWKTWPGVLISFLFAALMLSADSVSLRSLRDPAVIQQGVYVWVLALGQLAIGCFCVFAILPLWHVDPLFAHVIELGWVGGHGAAGSFKALFPGSPAGDIALFSATTGLIWGSLSGLLLVGWLRRRNLSLVQEDPLTSEGKKSAREIGESLQAMGLSLMIILVLVLVAYLVRDGIAHLFPARSDSLQRIPVFFIAILIALPVRIFLDRHGLALQLEMSAWLAIVLDALIASALASLTLQAFLDFWPVFLLLMFVAALWCLFCFFFLAPRMLPDSLSEELALLNYGMSTGITAVGLMLLQSLHSRIPLRALQVYGLAAPLSAPFIGGGVISLALPHFTTANNVGILGLAAGAATVLLAAGAVLFKKGYQTHP